MSRYYVGSTSVSISERLANHNWGHSGFTGKASDWRVIHSERFATIKDSRARERKIKKRSAARYLGDLGKRILPDL